MEIELSYIDTLCWRMTEFHCTLRFNITNGYHERKQINKLKQWWNQLTYRDKVRHSFIWFTKRLFDDMRPELEDYYELLLKHAYFFAPAIGGGEHDVTVNLQPKILSPSRNLLRQIIGHEVDVDDNYFKDHEVSKYWSISLPRDFDSADTGFCTIYLPSNQNVDVVGVVLNGMENKTWIVYRINSEKDDFKRYGLFSQEECEALPDSDLTESFERVKRLAKNVIIKYDNDRTADEKEVVILPPGDSNKAKKWNNSSDSRSLFKPTSLKGYKREDATEKSFDADERREYTKINFSHRVTVIGHWRKLTNPSSFGKNQFEAKCHDPGKTWVNAHERGGTPASDVVKKTENVHL